MARGHTPPAQPAFEATALPRDPAQAVTFTEELRVTQRVAGTLLRLIDRTEITPLPGGEGVVAALQDFVAAEIPTARALARAALAGAFEQNQIYILWARTRKAFHAAAPAVMDMFLAKMENENLPYSERLLVEAMKGIGLLTPSEPVKQQDRENMLTRDDVRAMTDDELRRKMAEGMDE